MKQYLHVKRHRGDGGGRVTSSIISLNMLDDDGPNNEVNASKYWTVVETERGSGELLQGLRGDGVGRFKWNY
jgi:hypothetical protein